MGRSTIISRRSGRMSWTCAVRPGAPGAKPEAPPGGRRRRSEKSALTSTNSGEATGTDRRVQRRRRRRLPRRPNEAKTRQG
eukprot:564847-Pyramimonas_sp.AAC.1